jgi:hypothetical protein
MRFKIAFTAFLFLLLRLGSQAQDVEALLTQVSLQNETAKQDLIRLGPSIFPKLLDYALYKQDLFVSQSAIYAISLLPDSDLDLGYISEQLLSGNACGL